MLTDRLVLRRWRDTDRAPFARMNADPVVMEHYVAPLTEAESNAMVDRIDAHFDEHGWGLWAVDHASWGHGYAPEAARATLDHGFNELGLDEIVSFTTATNLRSQRVMQKLGMTRDPADDFEHPNVPPGHPLRPHVLYRITAV